MEELVFDPIVDVGDSLSDRPGDYHDDDVTLACHGLFCQVSLLNVH